MERRRYGKHKAKEGGRDGRREEGETGKIGKERETPEMD